MLRKDIRIASSHGGQFDCYLVTPDEQGKVQIWDCRYPALGNRTFGQRARGPAKGSKASTTHGFWREKSSAKFFSSSFI